MDEGDDEPEEPVEDDHDCVKKVFGFVSGLVGSLFSILGFMRPDGAERSTGLAQQLRLVQQLGQSPIDTQAGSPVYALGPFPRCTEASNLRRPGRHFTVVTTAALPWKTGPAVNPLLRALHLARRGHPVLLLLPWVQKEDQVRLFPDTETFDTREDQERYILNWCRERGHIDPSQLSLEFRWYEASYVEAVRSIFPTGDCSQELGDSPRDVLILEEPEHLCWYHNGQRWTKLFKHVIGVVHTNYQVYLQGLGYEGLLGTAAFRDSLFFTFTSLVCSAYCDITVKLSGAGIVLPNEVNSNVHGVRDEFLDIGRKAGAVARSALPTLAGEAGNRQAEVYFIGKAVLQKGWAQLLDLLAAMPAGGSSGGSQEPLLVDACGSGPDFEAIAERAARLATTGGPQLRTFRGLDHADERFWGYKVLVNPSVAEMLCTVTAEALAMGKRVVLPEHVSNEFFKVHFPDRCHFFSAGDAVSFAAALESALAAGDPQPLLKHAEELLSWDAAIERLCDSSEVRVLSGSFSRPSEVASARLAYELHKGFQTDAPALSDLLKGATLKSRTPWEDYMVQWRQSESSRRIFGQIRRRVRELQRDLVA